MRTILGALMLIFAGLATPAMAASFDCAAAQTPMEHAICDTPRLSSADEVLAKAFATAIGGVTEAGADMMRSDQRDWLHFAQAACTDNAQALKRGRYEEGVGACMANQFNDRVRVLENSRMIDGHRFIVASSYQALPDPDAEGDPDYNWKVATHELSYPLLDDDDAMSADFKAFISPYILQQAGIDISSDGNDLESGDGQSDTNLKVVVSEVTDGRITLEVSSDWYGHGAAHPNWTISYMHYMTAQKRGLEASDLFDKDGWEAKLAELAFAQLQADHSEWLQVSGPDEIADAVAQPARWRFDSDYGLTIQFQPYEVAAYAYGAPTVVVNWDALADYTSSDLDSIRYGN